MVAKEKKNKKRKNQETKIALKNNCRSDKWSWLTSFSIWQDKADKADIADKLNISDLFMSI